MKKIIVAHPGKQHSYRTASALNRNGFLFSYITSVYMKKNSLTKFLFCLSAGKIKNKISSHYFKEIPNEKVKLCCQFRGCMALVINKIPFLRKYYSSWNNKLNDTFGKKVAKEAVKNNVQAVISYDYNSAELFKKLKQNAPGIIRILDVSISTRPFMKQIFQRDFESTGEKSLIDNYPEIWNESNLQRTMKEIELSDYFFAPSRVVKKSLVYCGADEEKIKVIPYGADCKKFEFAEHSVHDGCLRLIFVGAVDYRKGIHHLLKVISEFPTDQVDLKLVGEYRNDSRLYKEYKDIPNIHFCGFVDHNSLNQFYRDSDVFVFPSLGEGFAMVILEAMCCGLPVLLSNLSGGNDAVQNGINGFEFEAGNDEQLKEKIQWFKDNPEKLSEMGKNARKTAEEYTWEKYYENVQNAVNDIISGEGK